MTQFEVGQREIGEESITFGMIKSIDGEDILVDLNHPLAGHSILLKVKILKVT